jgi:hypothetical protein
MFTGAAEVHLSLLEIMSLAGKQILSQSDSRFIRVEDHEVMLDTPCTC